MQTLRALLLATAAALSACAQLPPAQDPAAARSQVFAAERAFAKSMADRDLQAFGSFVSREAVFFGGPTPLRGREQVVNGWTRYFAATQAPFSWEPEQVEVLESGTLALSSGPVSDPSGKVFARFTSIWRQEAPGIWRVIFDKGSPVAAGSPQ